MRTKLKTSVTLSLGALKILKGLIEELGISKSAVIEIAIREYHKRLHSKR